MCVCIRIYIVVLVPCLHLYFYLIVFRLIFKRQFYPGTMTRSEILGTRRWVPLGWVKKQNGPVIMSDCISLLPPTRKDVTRSGRSYRAITQNDIAAALEFESSPSRICCSLTKIKPASCPKRNARKPVQTRVRSSKKNNFLLRT